MLKYFNILVFLLSINAFAQEPGMKNISTINGLPSDEVYKSLLDSKGYLWFATNSGVCYYDGLNFTTLDMSDGLIENTILEIEEDSDGRIWFVGISGSLSYYENGGIIPFVHNNIIRKEKRPDELIAAGCFQPVSKTEVKMIFNQGRFLHIKDGKTHIKDISKGDSICINKEKDNKQLCFKYIEADQSVRFFVRFNDSVNLEFSYSHPPNWAEIINYHLYQEFDDRVVFFTRKKAFVFHENGEVDLFELDFTPVYSLKGVYGGIWIGTQNEGLMFFSDTDFDEQPRMQFLKNQYITSLRYDQNQRGWVTTLTNGVYNVQSLYITNYYRKRIETNHITKIVELDNGSYVSFSQDGHAFILDNKFKKLSVISVEEINKELVYQVKKHGDFLFVATSNKLLRIPQDYFVPDASGEKPEIDNLNKANVKDFVILDSIIWVATSSGLYFFPDYFKNGSKEFKAVKGSIKNRISRIVNFPTDSDDDFSYLLYQDVQNLWKLRYLKKNPDYVEYSWFETNGETGKLTTAANDLYIHEENIYVGTKGRGLICLVEDSIICFDKEDGLLSNQIKKVECSTDSVFYLGTNKGLNIIRFNRDKIPQIDSIQTITTKDGLMSNNVHDVILKGDHVLCATNIGLSLISLPEVTGMKDVFPVYISGFEVNGIKQDICQSRNFSLKSKQNNIRISFNALDLHDKEGISYFYRLFGSGNNDWIEISESQISFPLMPSGKYRFEVKAVNSYGFKSNNFDSVSFEIEEVFYKTWVFRIGILCLTVGILFFGLRYNYSRRNQLLQTEKKLIEFQQQSLTRVINPHFLMNVFNSINSNLFNKRPAIAMAYIKDVGDLVKQIFNSSYYNKITIEEEAKLLRSYINIEKRRSPFLFVEAIKFEENIKTFFIPSLMIQIFVENSIHHGFSDFKKKGALISVYFKDNPDYIICEIIDNGMGISASKKLEKTASHKPRKHGIDIIKERLELLNKNQDKFKYRLLIQEVKSGKSNAVIGTKVEVWFPKKEKQSALEVT